VERPGKMAPVVDLMDALRQAWHGWMGKNPQSGQAIAQGVRGGSGCGVRGEETAGTSQAEAANARRVK